ncbi:uncharacterized protein LOC116853455 isoform X2 [Odontomachus brunneus]|uniref:uncharacterized protein LOC116852827 isoform X2 n=1 Tax=Odontomachus brunneus TaxID=486640 RepID=UPI0013F19550|nr:uncharacterized protein LOC116852827 isoform X2 [Odontomachus brunneus]XP_032690452.1 uncharacterized protein LOC116853455 isoform X2 [Odontomachus brunneus]
MNKNQSGCFLNIKCGYCGSILTVDTQEQILCHNCFQKYDEERHAISINEDFVAIIVEASNEIVSEDTSNEQYSTDHRDEMLINIVQTKPALWNFQIPLRERTKAKKKALWKEVENMLGGLLTMDDAMKRWKYLRDCYVRYKRQINTYVPSGSAAQPSKKQKVFRFYEVMQFIDDPLESARYIFIYIHKLLMINSVNTITNNQRNIEKARSEYKSKYRYKGRNERHWMFVCVYIYNTGL